VDPVENLLHFSTVAFSSWRGSPLGAWPALRALAVGVLYTLVGVRGHRMSAKTALRVWTTETT
jgi:hypothetical protein